MKLSILSGPCRKDALEAVQGEQALAGVLRLDWDYFA
jgi:hypothetical protein